MSYLDKCKIKFLNINGKDMPDSEYFALKGYTSVSRLKLLDPRHDGSPEKYLKGFDFGYNESLILGTVVHSQLLQPDDFILSDYENKPSGKLGFFIEKVYKNRQSGKSIIDSINQARIDADYYVNNFSNKILQNAVKKGLDYYIRLSKGEFQPKDNKEVFTLSKRLLDAAHASIASVNNSVSIQKILRENLFEPKQFFNEIALFSDIEVTLENGDNIIIPFKGKLDSVVWDPENKILYLNDVKTTSKDINYFMDYVHDEQVYEGVFSKRSYHMQLAKIVAL